MAAVSQKIPNLLGGVSQQPDPVKLPGQVREAVNVYLDPTFGCRKRPGTEMIRRLAGDIPRDARWFPIFRDNNERYVVCIYNTPAARVRVWDLNNGEERVVITSQSAIDYFDGANKDTIQELNISDYTLLTNTGREVTMSGNTTAETVNEALVTINQVAYNTNYSIDLSDDGTQQKIYTATGIEVIPGSYEIEDDGQCSLVDAQNFQVDESSKIGLSFRLVNQCQAYLAGSTFSEYKVTKVNGWSEREVEENLLPYFEYTGGSGRPGEDIPGLYRDGTIDEDFGDFVIRWHFENGDNGHEWTAEVQSANFVTDNPKGDYVTGNYGNRVRIDKVDERYDSDQRYVSRYTVDAVLQNGGQGWREGDQVTVQMGGRDYTIRVTGDRYTYAYADAGSASFTTPTDTESGVLDLSQVVDTLRDRVSAISGFTADSIGNVIKITRDDGRDFNVSTRGGTVNSAMTAIKGSARDVADLPGECFDQFILKVNNTEDSDADDYYVKFTTEAPGIPGAGSWEETVAPGIETTINSSTMPHALIRQADGTFTLDALNSDSAFGGWAPREVGDETSNPKPSFVGQTISNMFFFANRLGFLSEDTVVMSQPGDYFNFFSVSALTVSDADPIDITASSTKPAILKAAVGTPKGLILFAETSQFLLATSEIAFSSSTVKLTEISNYFYKSRVMPLNSGVSVSFISESNTYSKVMEMAVDSVENRPVVADITRVIPEYLPPNFEWGEVMTNNNMIFYGDNTEEVYVFKFFNNGEERQLAGWAKWEYPAEVHMLASEDDMSYLVMFDITYNQHVLCKSKLIDDPDEAPLNVGFSKFTPRLDAMMAGEEMNVTPYTTLTSKIFIPQKMRLNPTCTYNVITVDGPYAGTFVRPTLAEDFTLEVDTKLIEEGRFIVGIQYETEVILPSIFMTQESRADRVNIPQVTFLYLDLYYSGRYEVFVEKLGYTTKQLSIEQTTANVYDANVTPISEINTITVPIFSRGDIVKTTVTAPDPFPSSITGYSWEGTYNNRGVSPIR